MSVQNVVGALVSLKNITKDLYEPHFVWQAVFSSSLLQIEFGNIMNIGQSD